MTETPLTGMAATQLAKVNPGEAQAPARRAATRSILVSHLVRPVNFSKAAVLIPALGRQPAIVAIVHLTALRYPEGCAAATANRIMKSLAINTSEFAVRRSFLRSLVLMHDSRSINLRPLLKALHVSVAAFFVLIFIPSVSQADDIGSAVKGKPISAQYANNLKKEIDVRRNKCGLAPADWKKYPKLLDASSNQSVKVDQVNALRAEVRILYNEKGIFAYPQGNTVWMPNTNFQPTTLITATHFEDIKNALYNLACGGPPVPICGDGACDLGETCAADCDAVACNQDFKCDFGECASKCFTRDCEDCGGGVCVDVGGVCCNNNNTLYGYCGSNLLWQQPTVAALLQGQRAFK